MGGRCRRGLGAILLKVPEFMGDKGTRGQGQKCVDVGGVYKCWGDTLGSLDIDMGME